MNHRHKHHRTIFALAVNFAVASAAVFLSASQARAGAGDLFASDPTAGTIRVYALDGSTRIFASGLDSPQGLTFDRFGNLFVAEKGTGNVYMFTADATRSTFATGLFSPIGIAFDGTEIGVSENGNDAITHLDSLGNASVFQSIANPIGLTYQRPNLFLADGSSLIVIDPTNVMTTFSVPNSLAVAVNGAGNAFVSDSFGNITEVTHLGGISTFATGLTTPNGMAFRPRRYSSTEAGVGNLFVAEKDAGLVSQYTMGGTRSVFATGGNPEQLAFELILPGKLLNISTRLNAQTGDNVLIGGFILAGDMPKEVLIRAIGPELSTATIPVPGALEDPVLELHMSDGTVITNDDWRSDQEAEIEATGLAPTDDRESAILVTLAPGPYTAILHGKDGATGNAMVEVYDLDKTAPAELGNISTRGFVQTGDDCMIGGFIIDPSESARVLVRAIGPTLAGAPIPVLNPLQDPTLELHDVNGNILKTNDNWKDTAEGEIMATGIAPTDDRESAILANLRGGNYTAVVRGADGGTGVALVEVYHLP